MKLSVVCWLWQGKTMGMRVDYTARHVNILASMVSRHLRMPYEMVCVTDTPEGIDGSVRIVPIWDDLKQHGRCFVRLKAFAPGMQDILGERFVSLDLDTLVVGNLDPLFDRPGDFVIWADPSRITPYCGSMWMVKAGSHPEVFTEFDIAEHATLKPRFDYFGSDQAWMAYKLPNAATWTKHDGVLSFKNHILRVKGGEVLPRRFKRKIRWNGTPPLPEHARIIHFHGRNDPTQRVLHEICPWIAEHYR